MSGQYSGLQAHLKKDSPKSIFTYCHEHVLNLIIGDITNCCIPSQNLFEYCQQTAVFLSRSYKKTNLWRNILQEKNGSEKLRKLKKKLRKLDGIPNILLCKQYFIQLSRKIIRRTYIYVC